MNTYIALLRGINVGGNNKLPMRDLVSLLEGLGLQNVKTYIQSGNIVCQSDQADPAQLSQAITGAIRRSNGFAPYALILDLQALEAAMAANPFPEGVAEPKSLHLFFMDESPQAFDTGALDRVKTANERYQLIDKVFYLHTPDGIGRSKLAEIAGKGWGVNVTARNWRTVNEVMALATSLGAR
ncbi:MAG: DUF1697 domain-containing protein [Caldilineaceae bacterium]